MASSCRSAATASQRLYTRSQIRATHLHPGFHAVRRERSGCAPRPRRADRRRPGVRALRIRVTGVLVLLAERDPFAAELAEYLLRTEGYEVILALDAAESERLYEERQPAVVVLDLMISGGRGVALCAALAARGARVIAVSSVPQRERAVEAGADAFLPKPLEPLQLVSAVRDLLGTSALRTTEVGPIDSMTERLSSGSTRLDAVLGGGLPTNAINLIIGPPGSGKTILAEQYLFHNATEERPGLFLSTVSEPFDKVLRYGESLAFFDAGRHRHARLLRRPRRGTDGSRHRGPGRPDRRPVEGAPARDSSSSTASRRSAPSRPTKQSSGGSSTTSPAASPRSPRTRSGSASTSARPPPTRRSSRSPTRSSPWTRSARRSARPASCRS